MASPMRNLCTRTAIFPSRNCHPMRSNMSSNRYRYAIIGTGRPHGTEGATGFGMAHTHWPAFRAADRVDLIAIAEIRDDPAQFFLSHFQSDAKHYTFYRELLEQEKP